MNRNYLKPDWPAPPSIKAFTTTRKFGHSKAPYDKFNLADHVEDDPEAVKKNRQQLREELALPTQPLWIHQVHGTKVISLDEVHDSSPEADAVITQSPHRVCAVLTADCLPILLCNSEGNEVGAIHAGWKGLLAGVIDSTLEALNTPNEQLMVWLGPAIGPDAFEVDAEIRDAYMKRNLNNQSAFKEKEGHWHGDIYQLAKINLLQLGVHQVYGGNFCTYTDEQRFYSFRRSKGVTGRMASIIWIEDT